MRRNQYYIPKKKKRKTLKFGILCLLLFFSSFVYQTIFPKLPQGRQPVIFYSNQCRHDLRLTILKAIHKTKKSLHMVMFGLSDTSIISAIRKKYDNNVNLLVYYDKRSSPHICLPKKVATSIKKSGLLHQKILILDEEKVFIGSANMTRSSLSMHDNMVIGLHSPDLANFLISKPPFTPGNFKTKVGKQEIEVWLLPDIHNKALTRIKNILESAKNSLSLVMFTLTHPLLIEEIIIAKKRGVNINVTVDFQSSLGSSSKAVNKLKKAGIKVNISRGPQLLHHKYLFIDGKTLITGSTNWTKAAFKRNCDCFLIVNNLTKNQKKFMKKLEKIIALETN